MLRRLYRWRASASASIGVRFENHMRAVGRVDAKGFIACHLGVPDAAPCRGRQGSDRGGGGLPRAVSNPAWAWIVARRHARAACSPLPRGARVIFAGSRKFAEEWTYRFLSTALADTSAPSPNG